MTSTRSLAPAERIIVALDVSSHHEANQVIDELDGVISFYKIGFQLFLAEGMSFVRSVTERGHRVFLDLKMDDVGETIASGVREIAKNKVDLITIHGGAATARAAVQGRGGLENPKILSLTLLSSMDSSDLIGLGILGDHGRFENLLDYVMWRTEQAVASGVDGLIASGEAVAAIRAKFGSDLLIVTPGIRPAGVAKEDHKRALSPREAIDAGADYLVVGRPIRNAPNRRAAAQAIIAEIS